MTQEEVIVQPIMQEAIDLMASVEVQLTAQGLPESVVEAGIMRALGAARYKTRDISDDIRERALTDVLRAELASVETWVSREIKGLSGE